MVLRSRWTWGVLALFVVLTVIYFRHVIWSPSDALLTRHLATDLYGHFVHVWERLELLKQGFLPLGDYWVQRGGGYPAASNDQLIIPQEILLMGLYALTGSFTISLKILVPFFYLATLTTAYWYGLTILRHHSASLVLAIAFTFSMYGVNQLEHLELIGVAPLILLTLIFFEKTLIQPKRLYIVLTSVFLFSILLSQPYPLYFTLLYIGFRVLYQLRIPKRRATIESIIKIGVLFILLSIPYILPQLLNTPNQSSRDALGQQLMYYSQPSGLMFFRNIPFTPYLTEINFMYLGASVILLALLPTILKSQALKSKLRPLYVFNLIVAILFMLYSIGRYGPFDLASWVHDYMPLAYFIRVPGRAMIIGYLSLSICAAIGFMVLLRLTKLKRILPITIVICMIIFADLTIGFEPPTAPMVLQQNSAYQFIETQPGDFRIIELSSVHDQQAMTIIYTKHDTLNSILWAYGHFEPLQAFTKLYLDHINLKSTAEETAYYGVKYIIVNSDPQFSYVFKDALNAIAGPTIEQVIKAEETYKQSSSYKLVHNDNYINVYENLKFRGMIFSNDPNVDISTKRPDPNTIIIDAWTPKPNYITISQSYAPGWTANFPIYESNSVQRIYLQTGDNHITMQYKRHRSSLLIYPICYLAAIGLILRKRILRLIKGG